MPPGGLPVATADASALADDLNSTACKTIAMAFYSETQKDAECFEPLSSSALRLGLHSPSQAEKITFDTVHMLPEKATSCDSAVFGGYEMT